LAALNTAEIAPAAWTRSIAQAGSLLLVVVLAAVGLGVDLVEIRQMGLRPLTVGLTLAGAMALLSAVLIWALQIG
jgi:uncharacterized membrane protein YadS